MKGIFLDTGIMMEYLQGSEKIKTVFNQIRNKTINAYTLELILCEFYYHVCRNQGRDKADIENISMRDTNINVIKANEEITREAGLFKCKFSNISIVDAHIIGCAKIHNLTIYTTDSSDFKNRKDIKGIKIKFFSFK